MNVGWCMGDTICSFLSDIILLTYISAANRRRFFSWPQKLIEFLVKICAFSSTGHNSFCSIVWSNWTMWLYWFSIQFNRQYSMCSSLSDVALSKAHAHCCWKHKLWPKFFRFLWSRKTSLLVLLQRYVFFFFLSII